MTCVIGRSSSSFYTPPLTHQNSIPFIPPRITTQQNPSLLFIQMNIFAIANKMLEANLVGSFGIHGIDGSQSAWGVQVKRRQNAPARVDECDEEHENG